MDIDTIKKKVSTDFMYQNGASFETRKGYLSSKNSFSFLPTLKFALYTIMYGCLSIGTYFLGSYLWPIDNGLSVIGFLLLGASLVFLVAFIYFLKDYINTITFNKSKGYFYSGILNINGLRYHKVNLNKIVALQILGEIVDEQIAPFNSFELNLVLTDTSRIHLIDHANIKSLLIDAKELSKFLNIPIWTVEDSESS